MGIKTHTSVFFIALHFLIVYNIAMDMEELREILATTICEEFDMIGGRQNVRDSISLVDTGNGFEITVNPDIVYKNTRLGLGFEEVVNKSMAISINRWKTENGIETEDEY